MNRRGDEIVLSSQFSVLILPVLGSLLRFSDPVFRLTQLGGETGELIQAAVLIEASRPLRILPSSAVCLRKLELSSRPKKPRFVAISI